MQKRLWLKNGSKNYLWRRTDVNVLWKKLFNLLYTLAFNFHPHTIFLFSKAIVLLRANTVPCPLDVQICLRLWAPQSPTHARQQRLMTMALVWGCKKVHNVKNSLSFHFLNSSFFTKFIPTSTRAIHTKLSLYHACVFTITPPPPPLMEVLVTWSGSLKQKYIAGSARLVS